MPSPSTKKHAKMKNIKTTKKPTAKVVKPPAPTPTKKGGKPEKPVLPTKPGPAKSTAAPGAAPAAAPAAAKPPARKGRKSAHRRETDFAPGELLLPGGPQTAEEVHYLLRGAVCAERQPAGELAIEEIVLRRAPADPAGERSDLHKQLVLTNRRFEQGAIEVMLPTRPATGRRTFQSVVDRARYRRREIGAFMRGLDLGRTETSHMDSHGEASLQSLMEWAARLENLMESEEPEGADYAQFHRGLDQLENTTEALLIDVEQTLRRLRDKKRS